MDVATNKIEKFSYKPWGMRLSEECKKRLFNYWC